MRPAGRETRVATPTNDKHASGKTIANFFVSCFSDVNGIQKQGSERLDVEAAKKCLAACASQWRQPSPLAMTHMRWLSGQSGHESMGYTLSVVPMSVGCKPGPSIGARHKDAGKHERRTPTPCATYREREREIYLFYFFDGDVPESDACVERQMSRTKHSVWLIS